MDDYKTRNKRIDPETSYREVVVQQSKTIDELKDKVQDLSAQLRTVTDSMEWLASTVGAAMQNTPAKRAPPSGMRTSNKRRRIDTATAVTPAPIAADPATAVAAADISQTTVAAASTAANSVEEDENDAALPLAPLQSKEGQKYRDTMTVELVQSTKEEATLRNKQSSRHEVNDAGAAIKKKVVEWVCKKEGKEVGSRMRGRYKGIGARAGSILKAMREKEAAPDQAQSSPARKFAGSLMGKKLPLDKANHSDRTQKKIESVRNGDN